MQFSLNKLLPVQRFLVRLRIAVLNYFFGTNIHKTCVLSMSCKIDKTYPKGIHIDQFTYVAFGASILSHDMVRSLKTETHIGKNCFIGAKSIILPGIKIGDSVIVAAGSVVTKDVKDNCIVAGNPAKVISNGINVGRYGVLVK